MRKALSALVVAAACLAAPALAQERVTLGVGRSFNNDYLGDGHDRWRTGSYAVSVVRGTGWEGQLPDRPFEVIEYRLGTEIIAPSSLRSPPAWDRRYAGTLSFMAQTYMARGAVELRAGAGLVGVGPSTGIGALQRDLHEWLSAPRPRVLDDQLGDAVYPVLTGEAGRPIALGGAELRPFVEARLGDEDLLRFGADLAFGGRETGALWLRDNITGQRYVGISGSSMPGMSFTLGVDTARVWDSAWLPASDGIAAEEWRHRFRAGVAVRGRNLGMFYGVTWLSEEFVGQPSGQLLGSVRVRMNF
jgi:hypothetical protein